MYHVSYVEWSLFVYIWST